MPEPWTLLTGVVTCLAPHRGGLKTARPWRSGAGKVRWVGGCSRKNRGKEGLERVCCHCVTAFVAENYAICLSEGVVCSQSMAVTLSLTHPGPH